MRLFLALVTMFAIPIVIAAPFIYSLGAGHGTPLVVPTVAILTLALALGALTVWLARRVLEPAERLEETRRILEDAYDRARAEALRDTLTGLGNHRAFQEEVERQWAIAPAVRPVDGARDHRPRRLQAHQRLERPRRRRPASSARPRRPSRPTSAAVRPGVPRRRRRVRARAARHRRRPGAGSWSAGCSRPASTASPAAASRTRSRSRPASAPRPCRPATARSLYRQADAALFWSKRHGRTCVTIYDPARHDGPTAERPPAELSAAVAQVAATGAIRAVFQPIFDLQTGAPRGYEGLVRPLPDSGFTDPGSLFEAAEATGRTGELDIACLNTVMETAARLRLPGSLTVNLSPRTLERDDFSVHALLRMIVRHGLDPRNIVLELTEREAVEDLDRLRQAVEACRVAGIRLAADDVGAGNAGLRLLSQLRFDIVKIDLSLVQGGAVRDTSLEIVKTLRDLADRWGALVVAEGIETPQQLDVVRSLGIGAGQGYLLGRPTDRPSTESLDLAGLVQGRGLAHRAAADDAGMSTGSCAMAASDS